MFLFNNRYNCDADYLDVTKQADMSGFYRHLYKQTFAERPKEDEAPQKEKEEAPVTFKNKEEADSKSHRQYRPRKQEEEEEEEANSPVPAPEAEPQVESEPEEPPAQPIKRAAASAALVSAAATDRAAAAERAVAEGQKKPPVIVDEESSDSSTSEKEEDEPPPPPKIKIDIWKKRTEGVVLEEAIQRYEQRKLAREQGLVAWPWFFIQNSNWLVNKHNFFPIYFGSNIYNMFFLNCTLQ